MHIDSKGFKVKICEKCFSPVYPQVDYNGELIHLRSKPTPKDPDGIISLVLFPTKNSINKLCYAHQKVEDGLMTIAER